MRVTAETKSATRLRILEVAQQQFAEHGFDTTTTRDIARASKIGVGTLFNYFPTKESIVECLVAQAYAEAAEATAAKSASDARRSLEEQLFAQVAALLRKLKPYRKYLPAVLETFLSGTFDPVNGERSLRAVHLEAVEQIIARHGLAAGLSPLAQQLYWTLYTGLLAFWASDSSPRQEDTLALLDESLAMFVGWLSNQSDQGEIQRKR